MNPHTDESSRGSAFRVGPRGFTLIELVVVIAVISVLIALLLPAIQSARETARRIQCTNNMLQLGTALANYASSNKVFPPGVVDEKGPITNNPVGYHFGWMARILPFIEKGPLYNQLNFTLSVYDESNETATNAKIQSFLCPSDGLSGPTNYVGCHHDVEAPIDVDNHGVFFLNSRVAYDDLTDGPATTILLGEINRSDFMGSWATGTSATLRNTGWGINGKNPFDVKSQASRMNPRFDPVLLQVLIERGEIAPGLVGGFRSNHSSSANFLFGDGSVRLLKNKIQPEVLRSLGHRADGNLIDGDAF